MDSLDNFDISAGQWATNLVDRAFKQRGPMSGCGRGPGRPWGGIVERTPSLWITWIVEGCRRAGKDPLAFRVEVDGVHLRMTTVQLTFGLRYYWLCPLCGRRCEAIFFTRRVGCRKCLRLGYLSQTHRPNSALGVLDRLFTRRAPEIPGIHGSRHYSDQDTVTVAEFVRGLRQEFKAQLQAMIGRVVIEGQ